MRRVTQSKPIGAMNMTPLIDVLLVLLVMMILTIPMATDSLTVDLPVPCDDCPALSETANLLTIDAADRLAWNGAPIDWGQLPALLQAARSLPVEPELRFAPDARAGYDTAARTMAVIRESGVTRFGFVGNEQYRRFQRD